MSFLPDDLADLYQEVILDHSKRPRNRRASDHANRRGEGHNPLCGDRVTVYLELDGDLIRDASFEGSGCAISTASASMMTEVLKGKTIDEAERMFEKFHHWVTRPMDESHHHSDEEAEELGKLAALGGVREFPSRVKCATLAWHTVQRALHQECGKECDEECDEECEVASTE